MATNPKHGRVAEGLSLVSQLMEAAFDCPREPRSDAYKLGARELLTNRVLGSSFRCAYRLGTAEADAYYAGSDEGRTIWQRYLEAGHGDR